MYAAVGKMFVCSGKGTSECKHIKGNENYRERIISSSRMDYKNYWTKNYPGQKIKIIIAQKLSK